MNSQKAVAFTASLIFILFLAVLVELGSCLVLKHLQRGLNINVAGQSLAVTGWPRSGKITFKSGVAEIDYTTNAYGFRDVELVEKKKPENTVRIAIFGDSFTEGWGVPQADIIAYRLRAYLAQKPGRKYEVINFGHSSSGPGFAYCVYDRIAKDYQPDIVIFNSFVGNDFSDSLRETKECLTDRNVINPLLAFPYSMNLYKLLTKKNEEEEELEELLTMERFPTLSQDFQQKVIKREVHIALLRSALRRPEIFLKSIRDVSDEEIAAYTSHVEAWAAAARRDHVKQFIWSIIPLSLQISDEQRGQFSEMSFAVDPSLKGDMHPQKLIRSIIQKKAPEIEVLDLQAPFKRASATQALYLKYDAHINSTGHDLIAQELYQKIR